MAAPIGILYIDDNLAQLNAIKRTLSQKDYLVWTALTVDEAIEWAKAEPYPALDTLYDDIYA